MRTRKEVESFFQFSHLPTHLQNVSEPFHRLAVVLHGILEPSAERTLALRKLWEAKNYAVWQASNQTRKDPTDV